MNKRGQAFVEFVIILPIVIFLLLAMIDIGKLLMNKNKLESNLNILTMEYQNHKNSEKLIEILKENNQKAELKVTTEGNYTKLEIQEEVSIITPGLNLIFKTPYYIHVERMISNES